MVNFILNEYLAIIEPSNKVLSDINVMKIQCKSKYHWNSAVSSKPHLTIFNIIQPAFNESRLTASLERNVSSISPFEIELCGFDHFPGPTCTLYVRLKDETLFIKMTEQLKRFSRPILKPVKGYPHRYTKKAHLTIAKGIPKSEFMEVWPEWESRKYQSTTNADRLLLLRRQFNSPKDKYQIIGDYPFLGKGIFKAQQALF